MSYVVAIQCSFGSCAALVGHCRIGSAEFDVDTFALDSSSRCERREDGDSAEQESREVHSALAWKNSLFRGVPGAYLHGAIHRKSETLLALSLPDWPCSSLDSIISGAMSWV